MKKITSKNNRDTKKFAAGIAKKILKAKPDKNAKIIALSGELGAGKTTFIQGFIRFSGSKEKITSPTFLIFRPYRIKNIKFKKIYHFDLYRINSIKEINSLGFREIISNPQNIVLIEWAEKIFAKSGSPPEADGLRARASGGKKSLPQNAIWINLSHALKENERIIEINRKIL